MSRGQLRIEPDVQSISRAAASEFAAMSAQAISSRGQFNVVLSGGSTPKHMHRLLSAEPEFRNHIDWKNVNFFWGDERHVPPDHPDSNYLMARETLLKPLKISDVQIHRIRSEVEASVAAEEYENLLRIFFSLQADQFPVFDLIFLGMGTDGHTASLFPGTSALHETKRLAVSNWVGKFNTYRITLTVPVINHAHCVIFLVSGEDKSNALKAVFEGPYAPEQLPAQMIHPDHGKLIWLVDPAAARMLPAANKNNV
jgi:6-phosphogluconolactonase